MLTHSGQLLSVAVSGCIIYTLKHVKPELQGDQDTIPETNGSLAPQKLGFPKRKFIFQHLIFRGRTVSFREATVSELRRLLTHRFRFFHRILPLQQQKHLYR